MKVIFKKILRYSLPTLFGVGLALVTYPSLHNMWLTYKYNDLTPSQVVQVYHDARLTDDVATVLFLSRSNNYQQNVLELPRNAALLFMWVDSVVTSQMRTYVYSSFKYGIYDYNGDLIVTYIRIREALYYREGIWQVGLGKVLDIGTNRIKNFDNLNVEV